MKKLLLIILLLPYLTYGQNKMGNTWLFGVNGQIAKFLGDTTRPSTSQLFWSGSSPNYPYIFAGGHNNICDSATGKLLFLSNGMQLFDTLGSIIPDGDSLVPSKIYQHDPFHSSSYTQSSLIIPKGSNGLYYVITPTVSDSTYSNVWMAPNTQIAPFDLLQYHVVDINANNGAGRVVEKNKVLLSHTELHKTMMQACRHSNGVDWWLLKQGAYGSNEIIRFLFTKDSVFGPYAQQFSQPVYGPFDLTGQFAFNASGNKFAAVQGKTSKLFLADFDRCTGELYNPRIMNLPIDSTTSPYLDSINWRDTISTGVCFSHNDTFIYVAKKANIYQLEYLESDSLLAWYRVQHGPDTTWDAFEQYGHLSLGPDQRIYIGKFHVGFKQLSVIDKPNEKGASCNFCRKCLRIDNGGGGSTSPPNMPDYTLGASAQPCWPLGSSELGEESAAADDLVIFPNPARDGINIESRKHKDALKVLYNALGQVMLTTQEHEMDVSRLPPGVYAVKVGGVVRKVVVE